MRERFLLPLGGDLTNLILDKYLRLKVLNYYSMITKCFLYFKNMTDMDDDSNIYI